jgi:NTE family protein
MKKTALVLSGGGFKGAFQVGALQYLKENWHLIESDTPEMKFDVVAGVSVGALNGLMIALNQYPDLLKLWDDVGKNGVSEIYQSDFIDTTPDQKNPNPKPKLKITWDSLRKHFPESTRNVLLRALFNRNALLNAIKNELQLFRALADNTPLKKKLQHFAKREQIRNCIYKCGYVSLNDGKYYSTRHSDFLSDDDFANAILASTAMPIVWEPVNSIRTQAQPEGVKQAVDGGVRDVSPLGDVIREIADAAEAYTIVIINCNPGEVVADDFARQNIAQIALRSLADIAVTEIFNNDINEFIDKNYIVSQIIEKYPGEVIYDYDTKNKGRGKALKFFKAIIIQPDKDILGDTLTANEILIKRRMEHGAQKAAMALSQYKTSTLKFSIV